MSKALFVGIWVCLVTLLSSYGAVVWVTGARAEREEDAYLEGIEYKKLQPLTVPMIKNGQIQGYVVARLVFTADARTLRTLSVTPEIFVVDEAFRQIYTNEKIDFEKMKKYDLDVLMVAIRDSVNKRLAADIVQDLLVEDLNYVARKDVDS